MIALITGAGGQLGRALQAAAGPDDRFVACTRAELDITDDIAVAAALGEHRPDILFNTAAYTAVDRAEDEPAAAFAINRDGAAVLARAARDAGARLVHVSTDYVFDGLSTTPYRPGDAVNPIGIYARSKAAGEAAIREILPDALIVRASWLYSMRGSNFVRTMLRLMSTREEVRVVSDQTGTPTHAASLAGALIALARRGACGTYHYGDAGEASWHLFAQAIHEEALAIGLLPKPVSIVPIPTSAYPTAARRPPFSVLDRKASWALIGKPARCWRVELRDALRQFGEPGYG